MRAPRRVWCSRCGPEVPTSGSQDAIARAGLSDSREVQMTRNHHLGVPRAIAFVLALGLCLASPAFAQRADRATISGVVNDNQAAAVPGATVTIKNEDDGRRNRAHHQQRRSLYEPAAGARTLLGDGRPDRIQEDGLVGHPAPRRRRDSGTTSRCRSATWPRSVEVRAVPGDQRDQAGREPHRRREVLRGPPVHHRLRRAPGRIGAAHAAGLPADAAQRRPDVPRQPVQLPHQRRPGDGHRELLRRRGLRLLRAAISRATRARRRSRPSRK